MAILPICRYADIGGCRYVDIADIFRIQIHSVTLFHSQSKILADILPMWLKLPIFKYWFADNRYADIEKKCRYADIADTL